MKPYDTKPHRLLPLSIVMERTGYRTTKIYALLKTSGAFPQPVRSGRSIRFVEAEIDAWVSARIAERDSTTDAIDKILVPERVVAAALHVSLSWLQKDRLKPSPTIPATYIGPHVRYDLEAVRAAIGPTRSSQGKVLRQSAHENDQ